MKQKRVSGCGPALILKVRHVRGSLKQRRGHSLRLASNSFSSLSGARIRRASVINAASSSGSMYDRREECGGVSSKEQPFLVLVGNADAEHLGIGHSGLLRMNLLKMRPPVESMCDDTGLSRTAPTRNFSQQRSSPNVHPGAVHQPSSTAGESGNPMTPAPGPACPL